MFVIHLCKKNLPLWDANDCSTKVILMTFMFSFIKVTSVCCRTWRDLNSASLKNWSSALPAMVGVMKKNWYVTTRDLDYSKQCIKCVQIYNLNVQWYCFWALDHATKVFCSIAARHPLFLPWLADMQCSWGTSSRETMQLNRWGLGFNMGYMGYKVVIPFDTVYAQEFQCCFPAQSLAFKFCLSEFRWKIGRDLWPQRLKPQWVNWWVEVSEHCTTALVNDGDASVPRHL